MIEEALRKRLQPIVNRRRRLHLAWRLSACWFALGLVGAAVLGASWYWVPARRDSLVAPAALGLLAVAAILTTIVTVRRSRRMQPDYQAVARHIEQQHPDLRALLLAAIEQEPRPAGDGQLGYLQEWVIGDALRHAAHHDWLRSISTKRLVSANIIAIAALSFLVAVLSRMARPSAGISNFEFRISNFSVTVTPGDTTVELGSPVVILARFEGRVPPEATLLVSETDGWHPQAKLGGGFQHQRQTIAKASGLDDATLRRARMTRNLDDPVFGSIIAEVKSDLLYHIEYAGRRTRDFKITTYEHPSLQTVDAKIVYPSYTNLPEKVMKDTRQVSVVEGSRITLTFTLNKPVATARLVDKDQQALDLSVDDEHPNIYVTSITAEIPPGGEPTQSRRYELHLADAQGRTNKMPPRFVIDVHKNMPAEVKPVFPNRDVAASPLEELTLEAQISDDFAVTAYGLGYTLAGTQSKTITVGPSVALKPGAPGQIRHTLALEELNAQPDQLLTYYFWAEDTGPAGNIRRTVSDIYFAEVRHFEEIFRESQSFQDRQSQDQTERQSGQPGQQGEQLARLQKQIISATWNIKQRAEQSGGVDEHKEDLDVVQQSQADVLQQARSALTQAQDPPAVETLQEATKHMDTALNHLTQAAESASTEALTPALGAEQSAYQELLKLREQEHQIARARSADRSRDARSARFEQQLQQLELTQRQNRYEAEQLARDQQQEAQRENLQVLNRLSDLARRQNEMSEKLREAEAALREAPNEQERQQALRELKRLRDQQLEALQDVDELAQRMERPGNRQRMAGAREQLDQSRSRIRQSADELEQGMVSRAVASATRAQRQLEQMRDEFRRGTSGQFAEQMRDMRERARQLDQRQTEIADGIRERIDSGQRTLTDSEATTKLAEQINEQRDSTEELMDRMRDVSEQAETSEPLLSRRLYDTLRRASTENVDRALEATAELLRRNFLPQARDIERRAAESIEQIRRGVEEAAESVLGDEAEALRLAQRQLDELIREVNEEAARAGGGGRVGDPNERAGAEPALRSATQARGAEPNQPRLADAQSRNDRRPRGLGDPNAGGRADPTGWGGFEGSTGPRDRIDPNGPLTGTDFRQWSDRLGEVEEMLTESDLRRDLATVRDRAEVIRAEFKRHGKEPQWDLVEQQITKPLSELHRRISDKLAQLQSQRAEMVPIDREPVPSRFAELVRSYFENLGGRD